MLSVLVQHSQYFLWLAKVLGKSHLSCGKPLSLVEYIVHIDINGYLIFHLSHALDIPAKPWLHTEFRSRELQPLEVPLGNILRQIWSLFPPYYNSALCC